MKEIEAQSNFLSRRHFLRLMAGASAAIPAIGAVTAGSYAAGQVASGKIPAGPATTLASEDDQLLEEVEKAHFQFFWEQANPQTGLVKDRANVRSGDNGIVASLAATGFGLTALCIG